MLEFTIYGIENERYNKLLDSLLTTLSGTPFEYKINQVKDIDLIIRSGVISIPSIYYKNTLIVEDHLPNGTPLRALIAQSLHNELNAEQLSYFRSDK